MGLWDAFSSDDERATATKTYEQQKKDLKKAQSSAGNQERYSLMAYEQGIPLATAAYQAGEAKAVPALQGAQTSQIAELDKAGAAFNPLAQDANRAYDLYGNFYGVGGQAGFNKAQSQWESSPLYQAMVGEGSQGMQALNRQAAQRGNPYNATDILQYQGDLAGRYLPQYTSGLWQMAGQAPEIAGAQANIYGRKADVYGQTGRDLATTYTGTANNIGNLYNTAMNNVSGNFQQNADRRITSGGQLAGAAGQYGQNVAAADAGAQANQWNALLGVAGMGSSLGSAALGRPVTNYNFG